MSSLVKPRQQQQHESENKIAYNYLWSCLFCRTQQTNELYMLQKLVVVANIAQ